MDLPLKIETRRLILRQFNKGDFEFFIEIIKDNSVIENIKYFLTNSDLKEPENLFKTIIYSSRTSNPILLFVLIRKEIENSIGSCGFKLLLDRNEAICFYSLLPQYRGFGFAIEAMKKLIEYGFLKLKLSKVSTFITTKNSAIWKVAERIGMKYLGHLSINELHSKAMYFSIEKNEFDAQRVI
jgi:RimJ/RimL family protein N-acetyltransferase